MCCLVNENCSWRFLPFLIDGLEKKSWRHHKNSLKLVRWRETQTANQVTGCCCKVTRETAEFTSPVYRGAELKRPSGTGDNSKNRNNATPSLHYRIFLSKSDLVTDLAGRSVSIQTVQKALQQKKNRPAGMPQGHVHGPSPKRMLDVYEDTEVCREDYLFSWQFCRVF